MALRRMDHVGIVVEDLAAAVEFFLVLGMERQAETAVEGKWVDRIIGLDGARSDIVMLRTPDDDGRIELTRFRSPEAESGDPRAPINTIGRCHLTFAVDDLEDVVARLEGRGGELVGEIVDYGSSYRLCYLRGPAGVTVELAEKLE